MLSTGVDCVDYFEIFQSNLKKISKMKQQMFSMRLESSLLLEDVINHVSSLRWKKPQNRKNSS